MKAIYIIAAGLAGLVPAILGLVVLAAFAVVLIFTTAQTGNGGRGTIPGLAAEVTVVRDAHAVPHIFADNRTDAYRALGFVHAQDRFFQMEFMRRTAQGRLSEVIGPPGLRTDRFMRTLGVYALAEASVEGMSADARAAVEAYAEGVNAWIDAPGTKRPPEMIVLGIPFEPWRPADSAAWVRLMALLLSGDFRDELLRADLEGVLTPAEIQDLWPDEPDDAPTTLAAAGALRGLATAIPDLFPAASASNEWVVSGTRSASGKPLLANDPHLGFGAPGMWHLARIVTPSFTASGAALPGQPFFMIGQNGHLAWGLTTTHADTQDLFIEKVHPDDPDQYLTPGGSLPFEEREETIRVRGRAAPEQLLVRSTRHGPVLPDVTTIPNAGTPDTVVSLAFAALREDDRTSDAAYGINSARTVPEFLAALRNFHAPMQNVVYAHRDGAFGFVAAGRLPIRPGGAGTRPVPGWTGEHDWQGFVSFDALPQRHNPATGVIVNANNRVAPATYPHVISNDWPEGFRAQRIHDLLANAPTHTPDSFAAIQTDILSLGARELLDVMIAELSDAGRDDPIVKMMTAWDGSMARDRPEPLIFATWSHGLREALIDDELGPLAARYRGLRPRVLMRILNQRRDWCDNRQTDAEESCREIVETSLAEARRELENVYGGDRSGWRWGRAHEATFEHPLFRFVPGLGNLLAPRVATGGGDFTINRGTYRTADEASFPHVHGAGLRVIFDMADPDAARYMIAPGQSGHIASPHYDDLAKAWRDGRYIVLNKTIEELQRNATSELTLSP